MIMNDIASLIKDENNICIMPHISADGDAIGSSLALGMALLKLNKTVTVLTEEEIPGVYSFLSGRQLIEVYDSGKTEFDVALALDTGDLDRLGKRVDVLKNSKISVNIDHHPTNTFFARYNYVESNAAAVGEVIYQLIKLLDVEMDTEIATCLYVALATDTGGFKFSNTTPVTHRLAADLINNGVNVAEISQRVFDATSLERVKLMGLAINSLEILEDGKVAFITLTDDMLKRAGAKEEDCDGIVNIARNIDGVEVSTLFRQRENGVFKVNFRSKSYVDVSHIANTYSGGGHTRASGCVIRGELMEIKDKVLCEIKKVL
jgi:phosphoesterase RecJ-like protein